MKKIELTKGFYTTVDDADYDWLNQWKWHAYQREGQKCVYAYRNIPNGKGGQTTIQMHRVILGLTDKTVLADHIDGDGLNNQRCNLRIADHSQNAANRKTFGRSGYRGVSLIKTKYGEYWYAKCSKGGVKKTLICKSEKEAAIAYNKFAKSIHGEFAKLNNVYA